MKDPVRWRDLEGAADAETRALLSGDRAPIPSADQANRIWTGIESRLRLSPGPAHVPQAGPAASTAGTSALAGKALVAVVLAVAGGVGLYGFHSRDRQAGVDAQGSSAVAVPSENPRRAESAERVAPAIERKGAASPSAGKTSVRLAAVAAERADTKAAATTKAGRPRMERAARAGRPEEPAAEISPPSATMEVGRPPEAEAQAAALASSWGPTPFSSPTPAGEPRPLVRISGPPEEPAVPVNQLLSESRQLARARAALRAHDPDRALELLKVGSSPTAVLAQEREALTIEALAAKPALRAKAVARARAFMAAYPHSPYRARIRALALEGE
jgi:hypothetical protein